MLAADRKVPLERSSIKRSEYSAQRFERSGAKPTPLPPADRTDRTVLDRVSADRTVRTVLDRFSADRTGRTDLDRTGLVVICERRSDYGAEVTRIAHNFATTDVGGTLRLTYASSRE